MCTGPRCTEDGVQAEAMFGRLGEQIDARPELRIKRTRTHCMVACRNQGPILVVYPEGVWYRCTDEAALERIVVEHLEGGREVSELIFHRLGEGDTCPVENEDA
jgi:(2Fe-2S) ferredoxin